MWIYDIAGVLWCEGRALPGRRMALVPCEPDGTPTGECFTMVVMTDRLRTMKRAFIKNK